MTAKAMHFPGFQRFNNNALLIAFAAPGQKTVGTEPSQVANADSSFLSLVKYK